MSRVSDVTALFARLASHLDVSSSSSRRAAEDDDGERSLRLSFSDLNRSLNLDDDSRVRVLDTALSLMCFNSPQVFDSEVKYSSEAIAGVLFSSIGCKVLRFQRDEVLVIGSSISRGDCVDLIDTFSDHVGHGPLYENLLHSLLRVLTASSCYRYVIPSRPILDLKSIDARNAIVSKFLSNFPRDFSLREDELPFRMQSWFLDPLSWKSDISNILHEATKRPFLCISNEFHERIDWRSITRCFALSPIMFIEARALLHRWFLLTGLASVLELLIALCGVLLDVVSRPTWWDISLELGAKLPFANAYFPRQYRLLRTLSGPLSYASLLRIVHPTSELFTCTRGLVGSSIHSIDHTSRWALAINFPCWFYFASALLFSEKSFQGNTVSECVLEDSNIEKVRYKEPPFVTAARYIAWIMDPVSKSDQDFMVDSLVKMSKSLASKQRSAGTHEKKTASSRKILRKPKFSDNENNSLETYSCQTVAIWLKELKSSHDQSKQTNTLFRRIPLGLLLGCLGYIDGDASELLLNYATTDRIVKVTEAESSSLKRMKRNYEEQSNIITWINEYSRKEAVAGTCLVFSLTDIAETMSTSLCDSEEAGLDLICRVKTRVGKYLIKCVQRQIQLKIDDENMDLCQRLKQWKHQGQRVLEIHKDLDDIIGILNSKVSSI